MIDNREELERLRTAVTKALDSTGDIKYIVETCIGKLSIQKAITMDNSKAVIVTVEE